LVTQAQSQSAARNFPAAADSIERALRIEPNNPLLWFELAKIRFGQGNYSQADNLARKSISLSGSTPRTQAAAWKLIADTLRARGRNPEAQEADARASALSGGAGT
jgi:tetratricopeptide (TPR) repeat protein